MSEESLLERYNYADFIPAKVDRWLNFAASPPLGEAAPDFPLWDLEGRPTRLSELWARHRLLIVEFGSFT